MDWITYIGVSGCSTRYREQLQIINNNRDNYTFHIPLDLRRAMASLIAILDLKGKPLIQRTYRDDVSPTFVEKFLPFVLDIEEDGQQVTPCFSREGINYMHIRHSNLYR